ncbi:hypothetical protein Tco_0367076 [Tanacetum coccineum]
MLPSTSRVSFTNASGSQPKSKTRNDRIHSPSCKSEKNKIVEIVLWYLDSGSLKHMTGLRDKLIIFVFKFISTVRFRNDHFAAIIGYGDLQFGNVLITRVYYFEGLSHNLFLVEQFSDSDLEVALMRYLAFGRHLEEIHVTWAHLEKKCTRLWTYTNNSQDYVLKGWRRRHKMHVTPSQFIP